MASNHLKHNANNQIRLLLTPLTQSQNTHLTPAFLYPQLWKATSIPTYTRIQCLLHSQHEAEDKITFDYALKLNGTIKIMGFIHLFNKYLKPEELCQHQHINIVYLLSMVFLLQNEYIFQFLLLWKT